LEDGLDEFDETGFRGISLDSAIDVVLLGLLLLEFDLSIGDTLLLLGSTVQFPFVGGSEALGGFADGPSVLLLSRAFIGRETEVRDR